MVSRIERGPLADWFWTIDRFFLVAFVLLMGLGLMLSFAASPSVAERLGLDGFYFVKRHVLYILPSLAVMLFLSFLSPRQVRRVALLLLVFSLVAMVMALFYGVEIKGARRWISFLGISIQPSEFMKPAFVVICAWLFAEQVRQPEIPGNLFSIILFGMIISLLIAQPDFGQSILVAIVWECMFFIAGISWFWIFTLFGCGGAFIILAYNTMPHVAIRIDRFFTGEGDSFQVDSAREAIIHGGWLGQGPGEGTIKRIIPDSHTDFIFSVAAEEFGIIFCIIVVSIFIFIIMRGFLYAFKEKNDFNRFAVAGLVLQIGLQSIINIGVSLHLLPAKGMTLPMISYGGSSMIGICITAGFLLALTRYRPEKRAAERSLFRVLPNNIILE
ncbi:Cell division protein FtsW [Liberibacter crescens BT-1]|uniref:Probable peptidoglycan glycosyltransferase FtsW n=1 Tax=Liberibacter crescens (strain BT-1) TaxID=1215343 RepID=L0ET43_LIBCB|nr:putative peptidoglycan glycosyltransferase FtsW [Liberibacter crescens]AGA64704.1 Cell division protein FtsW [Liberibacter crescens BT-1]AMC12797.1 cell division protein FtsW [Liberibacter crescens]